ncbi:MAG: tRNA pseudouridine(55) synthase TruB [Algicola sp.]|nr:tRNA pseudouridine(55) synthase TruB [Algicola sp.]
MARRRKGRAINGVLLIDKHQGETSNRVLQQVKRIYFAAKAGHTGALDPLATGMLPICLGEATKFSQFLLDTDKTYVVTAKLGVRTTTSDADGEVVCEKPVNVTIDALNAAIETFKGTTEQMPSMYSALKHEGQPLYKYARQGIEVPRKVRDITVYAIELLRFEGDEVDMQIHCSKGTYIRTIVDDMGEKLGCGAHVKHLRRLSVGHYPADKMITVEQLEALLSNQIDNQVEDGDDDKVENKVTDKAVIDALLLPMDTAAILLDEVSIDEKGKVAFQHGNPVVGDFAGKEGPLRVYAQDKLFLGVGYLDEHGQIAPKRVVNYILDEQ